MQQMTSASVSRSAKWNGSGANNEWTRADWFVALSGELGGACNIAKKLTRLEKSQRGNNLDESQLHAALANELSDTLQYLLLTAHACGVDLEKTTIENFNLKSKNLGFPERLGPDGLYFSGDNE